MSRTAADILTEAAETFRARNSDYKDNWRDMGPALAAFFPQGVTLKTPDDFVKFHFVILLVVKLSRYASNWPVGHADSVRDTSVYAAMLEAFDGEIAGKPLPASEAVDPLPLRAPQHTGLSLVRIERLRQVVDEGYDTKHDAAYVEDELTRAAIRYARYSLQSHHFLLPGYVWPWKSEHWKPAGPIRNLVKAAALLCAEIDRRIAKGDKE